MKLKVHILTALIATMVLAGCSSDDWERDTSGEALPGGTYRNSDVEMLLGMGVSYDSTDVTRAAVESDADSNFDIDGENGSLGVYCLAYDYLKTDGVPTIDWSASSYSSPMENVTATTRRFITGRIVEGRVEVATQINWSGSYYYPMGGWYKYRFYGYYPRIEQPTVEADRVVASYVLDGTQDIIYGNTHASESGDAYCATYFQTAAHSGEIPQLDLQHKLARLTFHAYAGDDAGGYTIAAREIRIKEICVMNVPTQFQLVVSDRNNAANEGSLVAVGSAKSNFYLRDNNPGSDNLNGTYIVRTTHTQEKPLSIGTSMMVPEGDAYYMRVTLQDRYGNDCSPQGYWLLQPAGGFQAGKSYRVEMKVNARPEDAQGVATIN